MDGGDFRADCWDRPSGDGIHSLLHQSGSSDAKIRRRYRRRKFTYRVRTLHLEYHGIR